MKSVNKVISEPYRVDAKDDFDDSYERYCIDEDKTVEMNGQLFYKALYITELSHTKDGYFIMLSREMDLKEGMTIIDDNCNHFVVDSLGHYYFRNRVPEWDRRTVSIAAIGVCENIGAYFSVARS